ncbi:hypothetical protein MTR67_002030 [Solanum verrucosum]|uniref:Tf2-1-like SH3-like domain-containing protein n=1 Tax=Solanum verrucosum TaxID=315347 RepID=A0AAF0PRM0_SOLVR|nr:hypothetical protein MTR67_002030 [Solanum verrucosum]
MRFGKKWKLSPRYVGPYQILRRIAKVAYELELPSELALVHCLLVEEVCWRSDINSPLRSNEDFVGETVSERFSMTRRRFDVGDYGEEMQDPKDYVKKVDKFILSEIQAKGEICWGLFALISYHK